MARKLDPMFAGLLSVPSETWTQNNIGLTQNCMNEHSTRHSAVCQSVQLQLAQIEATLSGPAAQSSTSFKLGTVASDVGSAALRVALKRTIPDLTAEDVHQLIHEVTGRPTTACRNVSWSKFKAYVCEKAARMTGSAAATHEHHDNQSMDTPTIEPVNDRTRRTSRTDIALPPHAPPTAPPTPARRAPTFARGAGASSFIACHGGSAVAFDGLHFPCARASTAPTQQRTSPRSRGKPRYMRMTEASTAAAAAGVRARAGKARPKSAQIASSPSFHFRAERTSADTDERQHNYAFLFGITTKSSHHLGAGRHHSRRCVPARDLQHAVPQALLSRGANACDLELEEALALSPAAQRQSTSNAARVATNAAVAEAAFPFDAYNDELNIRRWTTSLRNPKGDAIVTAVPAATTVVQTIVPEAVVNMSSIGPASSTHDKGTTQRNTKRHSDRRRRRRQRSRKSDTAVTAKKSSKKDGVKLGGRQWPKHSKGTGTDTCLWKPPQWMKDENLNWQPMNDTYAHRVFRKTLRNKTGSMAPIKL